MLTINNTAELSSVLRDSTLEPVQFPENSNLLLGYGRDADSVQELEELANSQRRSLHLR